MITIDLFHQPYYSQDGYVAFQVVSSLPYPDFKVYAPDGTWCGGTNATNELSRLANIRLIIKHHQTNKNQQL